ncbi:hypothetical protein EDI_202530 [Entamoeba dispar SAW760]|uniref:Uncharacterized protein n=1 Tax=Entamoeba dispar (strain ATCC PRA-260 / SAW760) TaxID=370354 RepID=B0ET80_ENTDS|nr:uncharacterized protein EDI_202530 [Entamoeba dispar SAW760]EDR22240.1 hypothetical protein EDI_202530 [Entamoeba dispar SAW760]|eukprot:EDR22240.1 hypothetical protein EDI_202530 [Entamoeba dispar SAW760]
MFKGILLITFLVCSNAIEISKEVQVSQKRIEEKIENALMLSNNYEKIVERLHPKKTELTYEEILIVLSYYIAAEYNVDNANQTVPCYVITNVKLSFIDTDRAGYLWEVLNTAPGIEVSNLKKNNPQDPAEENVEFYFLVKATSVGATGTLYFKYYCPYKPGSELKYFQITFVGEEFDWTPLFP